MYDISKKRLVLFDFDGTLTSKDTLIEFIRFYHGDFRFILGFTLLSPILVMLKLKLIHNQKAKEIVLRYFFHGTPETTFHRQCLRFSPRIEKLLRPEARIALQQYTTDPETAVAVVSASPENWVRIWCDQANIPCIATRLENNNGRITGKITGKNCFGQEKAERIQQQFDLSQFSEIIAYGDSAGDREMLALAHKKFYKPFRQIT